MRLDLTEIKRITVGAVKIWADDGFRFLSTTEEQLDAFAKLSDSLRRNAAATTGVRLDFETDSEYIAYSTLTDNRYELKLDGLLTSLTEAKTGERNLLILPKDRKPHRVTLHLPSHGESGALEYLELSDGATVIPHSFDRKLLFIGDSITQGYNSRFDTLSFAYQVSDHFNADSIIQGTGGSCFYPDTLVKLDYDPDTVIVAYGTNDANKFATLEEIGKNCKDFLEKLKALYGGAKIFVITPIWRIKYDEPKPFGHIRRVADLVRETAEELGLTVVDGLSMIPANEFFMADNLHPNDLGFALYAHNLIKVMERS
ncbi:MAG: SGNH/GDSL hydrolase family protein [Ruminococcaceae bacterium]|nr:SGNH/GDSL hydrolase family protein [Oscillospiraceae bacterium]